MSEYPISTYDLTYDALCAGLTDFVKVSESELAAAVRTYLSVTHNLVEGAAAAGLAGLMLLRDRLKGKRVGIVNTGSNIDHVTLLRVIENKVQ